MANFKKGTIYFVICSLLLVSIYNYEFVQTYQFELIENQIEFVEILHLLGLSSIVFSYWVLPISVTVLAFVVYHKQVKSASFRVKIALKKSILPLLMFCVFSLLWVAFIIPKANLHMMSHLYDIRMKSPEEPIQRGDVNLFKGSSSTSNIIELLSITDTSDVKQSIFHSKSALVIENEIEKSRMLSFPFVIFIFYYLGLFICILSRHQKKILLPIIGLMILMSSVYYYTTAWFEKLEKEQTLTPFQGQFLYILSLFTITIVLYLYAKHQLQLEQQSNSQ